MEKKYNEIKFRVGKEDFKRIKNQAKICQCTLSAFCRAKILRAVYLEEKIEKEVLRMAGEKCSPVSEE